MLNKKIIEEIYNSYKSNKSKTNEIEEDLRDMNIKQTKLREKIKTLKHKEDSNGNNSEVNDDIAKLKSNFYDNKYLIKKYSKEMENLYEAIRRQEYMLGRAVYFEYNHREFDRESCEREYEFLLNNKKEEIINDYVLIERQSRVVGWYQESKKNKINQVKDIRNEIKRKESEISRNKFVLYTDNVKTVNEDLSKMRDKIVKICVYKNKKCKKNIQKDLLLQSLNRIDKDDLVNKNKIIDKIKKCDEKIKSLNASIDKWKNEYGISSCLMEIYKFNNFNSDVKKALLNEVERLDVVYKLCNYYTSNLTNKPLIKQTYNQVSRALYNINNISRVENIIINHIIQNNSDGKDISIEKNFLAQLEDLKKKNNRIMDDFEFIKTDFYQYIKLLNNIADDLVDFVKKNVDYRYNYVRELQSNQDLVYMLKDIRDVNNLVDINILDTKYDRDNSDNSQVPINNRDNVRGENLGNGYIVSTSRQ